MPNNIRISNRDWSKAMWERIMAMITDIDSRLSSVEAAVSNSTASSAAVSISGDIPQNAQGVSAPTKKTVANAAQSPAGLTAAADETKQG